jgi:hypothetical protein
MLRFQALRVHALRHVPSFSKYKKMTFLFFFKINKKISTNDPGAAGAPEVRILGRAMKVL